MMSNTLVRYLAMLKRIPRYPRRVSTREIRDALVSEDFEVTQRTVQRDLKNLAEIFPGLATDGNPDAAGWFWEREATIHDVPGIDPPTALSFKLVEAFLEDKLPPVMLDLLHPYFKCADSVLGALDKPGLAQWTRKIRVLPRTQPLIPARIDPEVVGVIYEALFREKQFRGRYRRRDGDEAEYDLHPLGLVFRESVVYLVATVWNYGVPRQFALHRFQRCTLLEDDALSPQNFDLESFIRKGAFEYVDQDCETIRFEALFNARTAQHLQETPLSEDQVITPEKDEWDRVTATVKNSLQLRWWLLGFGGQVVVLQPETLRNGLLKTAESMVRHYQSHGNQQLDGPP
jgi:predicted DNA-binding transcriptional regulator YafY